MSGRLLLRCSLCMADPLLPPSRPLLVAASADAAFPLLPRAKRMSRDAMPPPHTFATAGGFPPTHILPPAAAASGSPSLKQTSSFAAAASPRSKSAAPFVVAAVAFFSCDSAAPANHVFSADVGAKLRRAAVVRFLGSGMADSGLCAGSTLKSACRGNSGAGALLTEGSSIDSRARAAGGLPIADPPSAVPVGTLAPGRRIRVGWAALPAPEGCCCCGGGLPPPLLGPPVSGRFLGRPGGRICGPAARADGAWNGAGPGPGLSGRGAGTGVSGR